MYVIVSDKIWDGKLAYLAWQRFEWDHGYFWTDKKSFIECLPNNTARHRFVFRSVADAWRAVNNLRLRTGYVIKLKGET